LALHEDTYENYIDRVNYVKDRMEKLLVQIEKELNQ